MSGRYSIMVRQAGSDREVELCRVNGNPHDLAAAAAEKTMRISAGGRVRHVARYDSVRVVDHEPDTVNPSTSAQDGETP